MIRFDLRKKGEIKLQTDLSPVMDSISKLMKRSIQLNFERGGRPQPWLPLKSGGETPLTASGRLYRSINARSGNNWAEVGAGASLPYALIHHRGGVIQHPGSTKRQAFRIDGKLIVTYGTKKHPIHIPARPYMVLQREDLAKIAKMIGSFIVRGVKGEDAIF